MKSMTGYGSAEYQDEKIHLILELKSYNNRYLDIIINQPVFLNSIEPEIRKYVGDNAERGRVELYLKIRELEEDVIFHLDKQAASAYAKSLRELTDVAGIDEKISLAHLLSFEGLLKSEKKRDIDEYKKKIFPLLETCLVQWEKSRRKEGLETAKDINRHLSVIYEATELFK